MTNGLARWSKIFLIAVLVQTPVLHVLSSLMDGFSVGGFWETSALAVATSVVLTLTYPLTLRFSFRFRPIIFLVASILLTLLGFRIAIWLVEAMHFGSVEVDGVWNALLVVMVFLITQSVAGAIWATTDDSGFWQSVRYGLRFRHRNVALKNEHPGVLFLEIDGLARPILEEAMADGRMPTLKRWVDSGTHVVSGWQPDLSSQTSASQAGILLGSNEGIPAFRWWSKDLGRPEVSSSYKTASALEARLSTGDGLLVGGASRWNIFTGDATDALATYSTVRGRDLNSTAGAVLYLSSPMALSRNLGLYLAEVVRERWQAWQQSRQNVLPRLHRTFKYALIRSATTVPMQEMNFFMLISDIIRGTPVVYSTFFAYDEVAHHSGTRSPDAFKVLTKLDAGIASLEEALAEARRPYKLVILSDHGQSSGATFKQRFGLSLQDLVNDLSGSERAVHAFTGQSEEMGNISAAFEALLTNESRTAKAAKAVVGDRLAQGNLESTSEQDPEKARRGTTEHDIVVMASGNLGLITFTNTPERVSLETLQIELPYLISGLVSHPGISFIMVKSDVHDEPVVISSSGMRFLSSDRLEGEDPLVNFPPTSRQHLLRTDGFGNVPDVLVMSMYDPVTQETAAFEELIGNHGGLGGPQQEPFVLHPVELTFPAEPVVGAGALHRVLKQWRRDLQGSESST